MVRLLGQGRCSMGVVVSLAVAKWLRHNWMLLASSGEGLPVWSG
jgi:hypothetical protein